MSSVKPLLVTTSIAYVNGEPHLGFAMESIEADCYARWARNRGRKVFFLTGTDEHGSKIYQTAKEKGMTAQEMCDKNAERFRELGKVLNISNDDFIRTTQKRHKKSAQEIWKLIAKNSDLEDREFEGKYCIGCETFLTERDLTEDGKCKIHLKELELIREKNIFFKLSQYSEKIIELIEEKEIKIQPYFRATEILQMAKEGLKDVSFSRPKETLPWGIEVPNAEDQVMYVWCDALSNYITALNFGFGEEWKEYWEEGEVIHFIGKDILRFHAGIWPGMLISAGLPLPTKICVHGFLTSEGHKMSKSLGNVVDPFEVLEYFDGNPDALRFFLLGEVPFGRDADYSKKRFSELYHSKLSNGLGNLLSRVLMLNKKLGDKSLKIENKKKELQNSKKDVKTQGFTSLQNPDLKSLLQNLPKKVDEKMNQCEIHLALQEIFAIVEFLNLDIDREKPWVSMKTDVEKAKSTIQDWLIALMVVAEEIAPFLPQSAEKMKEALVDGEPIILFPRVEFSEETERVATHKMFDDFEFFIEKEVEDLGIVAEHLIFEDITIGKTPRGLQKKLRKLCEAAEKNSEIVKNRTEQIDALNKIKKNLGYNPTEFPVSPEVLINIFQKNGKLPTINTLVDIYNYISFKYGLALGAHDVMTFQTKKAGFVITNGEEEYIPLNTAEKVEITKGEYAFIYDDKKVGCRFDSLQGNPSKITENTKNALLYLQGTKGMKKQLQKAKEEYLELLKEYVK